MIPAMSAADFGTGGTAVMNYGMQIGKDLAAYGEKIGLQIKDNRDKQQAMGSLPALQEAMQSFQAGDNAAGYSTLLGLAASDPSNQPLNNLIKLGFMGGQSIEESRYKMRMADAANARVTAGTPSGPSGSERLRAGIPALTNGDTGQGDVMTSATDLATQQRQADFAGEYPDEAKYMSNPDVQAEQDLRGLQPAKFDFNQTPPEVPEDNEPKYINEEHKAFVPVVQNYMAASPDVKQQVLADATTTKIPKGYETRNYPGLSEIFPELTGKILIPEVGTVTKIRRTVSTSDEPGSDIKETLSEVDEKTGEERYKFNIETANRIPSAVKAMTNQAPSGQRETFSELFKKNGGVDNAVISQVGIDMFQLTFKGNSKDAYPISKDQMQHLQVVQNIPAMSGSGYQFVASEKKKEKAVERFPVKETKTRATATATPERTSAKTKAIDEELQKLKEKELVNTAGKRKERIAEIDREIDKLAQTSTRPAPSTAMYPTRREAISYKGQADLQASRKRILELEKEKEKLIKGQ